MIAYDYLKSPVGMLEISVTERQVCAVRFVSDVTKTITATRLLDECKLQLQQYFDGTREQFNLPLQLSGTEFQVKVWRALLTIPYGQTVSYADIAIKIGASKAVRAVGGANNKNCLPIIIPCHRVIGKNSTLTGYAGGLAVKQRLLELECSEAQYPLLF